MMEYRNAAKSKGNKKSEILHYIFRHRNSSKTELTRELGLSMPTVLQNTKELVEQGLLIEVGEYESTGGRRAKTLAINGEMGYSIGLDITPKFVSSVIVDLTGKVVYRVRTPRRFSNTVEYYHQLLADVEEALELRQINRERVIGIGIALPGNINFEEKILIKSHALNLEGVNLKMVENYFTYPVYFGNDANSSLVAEFEHLDEHAIYLYLSNTVGCAIKTGGDIYRGKNKKAGEIGHVILVPGGRPCYCGKQGCIDAYCSIQALEMESGMPLNIFMECVERKEPFAMKVWDRYLNNLAISISNLRMVYDADLIIGGEMSGYLEGYMFELGSRIMEYNMFDKDTSHIKLSTYKKESAAIGIALHHVYRLFDETN